MGDLVRVSQNTASLSFPANTSGTLDVVTNTNNLEFVTVKLDGQEFPFSGTGQRTTIASIDIPQKSSDRPIIIKLEFAAEGQPGQRVPSKIQTGGPYTIGKLSIAYIVGEDGDDNDFNDAVCKIQWRTPQ